MISFGNKAVTGMYYGDKAVTAAYYGDKLVWSGAEPDAIRFTAAAGGAKVGIVDRQELGPAPSISMLSSTDGRNWGDYTVGDSIQLQGGEKAYFKAKTINEKMGSGWGLANRFFVEDGQASVAGPLTSLLGEDPETLPSFCFYNLFRECSGLVDASGIIMPGGHPNEATFSEMFGWCDALTAVPSFAIEGSLSKGPYEAFCRSCTSLTGSGNIAFKTWSSTAGYVCS